MTRSRRWACHALLSLVVAVTLALGTSPAGAQSDPRITLDRSEVAPGEPVVVTFEGFESQFVNIVVCGNLAYRGATDCNVTAGVSKETSGSGRPKLVQLIAHAPPVHCPCIVRATASSGDDFAVAPIAISGHPTGDLVGAPDGPLVDVEVEATEAPGGLLSSLRSALGGPTRYEATVSVRNNSTETLTKLDLRGSVGHWSDDDAVQLGLDAPGALEPGQTWTHEVVAEVSPPAVGRYEFEVIASGAGSTVTATSTLSHHPLLLYVFGAVLVLDLAVMIWRWIAKMMRSSDEVGAEHSDDVIDLTDHDGVIDLTDRVPVGVIDLDSEPDRSRPEPVS